MCVFVMSSEARTNKRYDERRQVTRKKGKKHKESGPWDNKMKNVTQTRPKKKKKHDDDDDDGEDGVDLRVCCTCLEKREHEGNRKKGRGRTET